MPKLFSDVSFFIPQLIVDMLKKLNFKILGGGRNFCQQTLAKLIGIE
jgi:hypothetical protein